MTLLISALTLGLILSLLAFGVYLSFRIFETPDITAEGSITLGGAVAAALLVAGMDAVSATVLAGVAGMIAGSITGLMATKCRINSLLAGILMMTALYSINLHVMGRSNLPLLSETTLATHMEGLGLALFDDAVSVGFAGWTVGTRDVALLIGIFGLVVLIGAALYLFLQTRLGTAMRATGDNPQMIRALGVDVDLSLILGLAISNGLIGLSGALLAQYQGFADVQMGIGIIVLGLASVIIGEALIGTRAVGLMIVAAVMGSVLFRLLVAIALRWGLEPNDLKIITAVFVFMALVAPGVMRHLRRRRPAKLSEA